MISGMFAGTPELLLTPLHVSDASEHHLYAILCLDQVSMAFLVRLKSQGMSDHFKSAAHILMILCMCIPIFTCPPMLYDCFACVRHACMAPELDLVVSTWVQQTGCMFPWSFDMN